jgi:hypothetical protein
MYEDIANLRKAKAVKAGSNKIANIKSHTVKGRGK